MVDTLNSVAICIGRFQPFHLGHHALLSAALCESDHVIVGIGSAFRARTPRNPFTWQERSQMILGAFPAEQTRRMRFVPLRDYFNVDRWAETTRKKLCETLLTFNGKSPAQVNLYGQVPNLKEGGCLPWSDWHRKNVPRHGEFDASNLRDLLFESGFGPSEDPRSSKGHSNSMAAMASKIPASVLSWLESRFQSNTWQYLSQEWMALRRIRSSWSQVPFPPTFITVDAVIRCNGHVLLIRRAKAPGEGLLALPGGFIEQHETVREAAIRELYEETRISLTTQELNRFLVSTKVFDHPQRSQFGRVVTHGHFFDIVSSSLPSIQADDDAKIAQWVPVDQICGLEDQFHDDHFFIIDHFLQVLHE